MNTRPDSITIRLIHKETDHPYIKLYRDHLVMPDGGTLDYNRIEQNHDDPGVVVMPLRVSDGAVGLIRQYRYPINAYSKELPRGFAQRGNAHQNAVRELKEETGLILEAKDLIDAGNCYPDDGIMTTQIRVYIALVRQDETTEPEDANEIQSFAWHSIKEMQQAITQNEVTDGITLATLMKANALRYWDTLVHNPR